MEIKYNKKKQEAKSDPVLESLLKTRQTIKNNSSSIVATLIIAVLLVGGYLGYSYFRKQSISKAQEAFGEAMIAYQADPAEAIDNFSQVVDAHANTPQAAYSALMIGDILMNQRQYDEALSWLEKAARADVKTGFVAGQAREALGVCYEAKGDYDKALDAFSKVLSDENVAYRHASVRWKMALINKKTGKLDASRSQCEKLAADTAAGEYSQKAKNLLAELRIM